MLDLLFVLAGVAFFTLAIAYVAGCDGLIKNREAAPPEMGSPEGSNPYARY